MITLLLINLITQFFDYLFTHALNPIYVFLMDVGTSIQALQVPAIIYQIISISSYFLPYGTILVLFTITIGLVVIGILLAFIDVITGFIKRIPFL